LSIISTFEVQPDSEDESDISFGGSDSDELPSSYLEPDDDPHGLGGGGGGEGVDELDDQLRSDGYSSAASQGSDGASSSAAGSSIYGGRKTARQRAKEMGGDEALELMSLPNRMFLTQVQSLLFINLFAESSLCLD